MSLLNAALSLGPVPELDSKPAAAGREPQRPPSLRDDLDALWGEVSCLLSHDDRNAAQSATPDLRAQRRWPLAGRRRSSCSSVASATSISLHDFCANASSSSTAALSSRHSLRSDASCSFAESVHLNYSLSSLDISATHGGASPASGSVVRRSRTSSSLQPRAPRAVSAEKSRCSCARGVVASLRGGASSAAECTVHPPSPLNPSFSNPGRREPRPVKSAPEVSIDPPPATDEFRWSAAHHFREQAAPLSLVPASVPTATTATQLRSRRLALMAEQSALESSIQSRSFPVCMAFQKLSRSRAGDRDRPAADFIEPLSFSGWEQTPLKAPDGPPQPPTRPGLKRSVSAPVALLLAPQPPPPLADGRSARSASDPSTQLPPPPPRDRPAQGPKRGGRGEQTPACDLRRRGREQARDADGTGAAAAATRRSSNAIDVEAPVLDLNPLCGAPAGGGPELMRGVSGLEHRRWNKLQSASWPPVKAESCPQWIRGLETCAPLSDVGVDRADAQGDAAREGGRSAAAKAAAPKEPGDAVGGRGGWLGSNWIGESHQPDGFSAFCRPPGAPTPPGVYQMTDAPATAFTAPSLGRQRGHAAAVHGAPTVTLDTVNRAVLNAVRASAAPGSRPRLGGRFLRPKPAQDAPPRASTPPPPRSPLAASRASDARPQRARR